MRTIAVTYGYIRPHQDPYSWGADLVITRPTALLDAVKALGTTHRGKLMPPADSMLVVYFIVCATAGVVVGLLTGLGIGRRRSQALRHELDLRKTEIKNQDHLAAEREQAVTLATERAQHGLRPAGK